MEHRLVNPDAIEYPERLRQRLDPPLPPLCVLGPIGHLSRFCLGVVASDSIPAPAVIAANEMLFTIREYEVNYVGGWHSVFETEVFRLALDRPTDPGHLRTVTALTARGLPHEEPDEFLGDRFGREGPFIGFPQKPEFYRQVNAGEILWLSATDPSEAGMRAAAILLRNQVACALSDLVFVPFAAPDSKTLSVVRWLVRKGIPAFTSEAGENLGIRDLGLPGLTRRTVGTFLESHGAKKMPSSGERNQAVRVVLSKPAPPHQEALDSERTPKRKAASMVDPSPWMFPGTDEPGGTR